MNTVKAALTKRELSKQIAAILKKNCTGMDDHDSPTCEKCAEMRIDFEVLIITAIRSRVVKALEAESRMRAKQKST